MRRVHDDRTLDIFFVVPEPVVPAPGHGNYAGLVSELVADILKATPLDRFDVAAQMSRLAGDDVSKHMLDAWSSPARTDHNIPFYRVPLLEEICQSHSLTDWLATQRGGRVAYGRDALNAELGRLERIKEEASRRARELKRLMGDGE